MKKYIVFLAGILLILLVGCGIARAGTSTISVGKSGKVTSVIVERFDKSYYDADGLKSAVEEAIEAYNKEQDSDPVSLKKYGFDKKKKEIRLVMEYASCGDYESFNQVTLFEGTIAQAREAYDFDAAFLDGSGKETDIDAVIGQNPDARVIVTNEPMEVMTRGKILCVSENVKILGEKRAQVQADENQDNENAQTSIKGYGYIIYE